MKNCIFCKIIKGELPSTIVYESSEVIAFKNIEPVAETHILICPKMHIENFIKIEDNFNFNLLVKAVQKIISDLDLSNGYKLVVNGGKYQFVPHFHWHLLAGKLEDGDNILNKT